MLLDKICCVLYNLTMKRYYSMSDWCKETYGKKLYRLSIDGGFSCPNREDGSGGCIFCSAGGSGDFSEGGDDASAVIERAKERIAKKAGGCGYIAYFQAFTNTYAPAERLWQIYKPIVDRDDIDILSIATRPDCLDDEVMDVLKKLSAVKPLWVELGLQTANDITGRLINRGYDTEVYTDAVKKLKDIGAKVITHVILGLPGESIEDMLYTIGKVNEVGSDGVKLQLLHVLKGTKLYDMYIGGEYRPLEMEEYFHLLTECLKRLRGDIAVHRMTGDGDKRILAAPLWSGDKKKVLNALNRYLEVNNITQGSEYNGG